MSLLDNPADTIYVSGSIFDTETVITISDELLSNVYSVNGQVGNVTIDTGSFITGVDLSSYATITNLALTGSALENQINNLDLNYASDLQLSQTGSALNTKIDNLSGVSVLTYGNQTIGGIKTFRDTVYIGNLYVTGVETIVNTQNFNVQSPYLLLNLTGGATDGGIFFVTGSGFTGINEYGPIIGFDHSNKFKFGVARRSDDLSVLNDIAAVQDITNYSGFVNNNFYPRNNPSGFLRRADLNQSFRNVYISSNIGNNVTAQIGNINLPFQTAQSAWNTIVSDGLFSPDLKAYVLNFYGSNVSTTNYDINIGSASEWPSRVYVKNLGPRDISLTITHEFKSPGSSAPSFYITDLGNQSTSLNVTSLGGGYAGGLPSNGGNAGNITIINAKSAVLNAQGGSASPGGIGGQNGDITVQGVNAVSINNAKNITSINSNIFNLSNFVTGLTVENSKIDDSPYISAANIDLINTLSDNKSNYYITRRSSPGTVITNNLELRQNLSIITGNISGIIIRDNITGSGRTKLGYRNSAFVADFASGIYLYPFVQSPNLVYNTGNQTISGTKTFTIRPVVDGTGVLLSGEVPTLPSTIVYTAGNQTISGAKTFYKTQLNLSGSSLNFYPVIETGATVTVTQANDAVTQTIDTVSDEVELTRGTNNVLYNPIYDAQGVNNPTNTAWNRDGWSDLSNIETRIYSNLYNGQGNFGSAIIGTELIMRDITTSKYYKVLFSAWQQGGGNNPDYKGFSYTRTELVLSKVQINGTGVGGNLDFYNRPSVNGTGVLLIGEAGQVPDTVVQTSGTQTISGSKTFTASTLFTSNIQASNIQANSTGIFSNMQISANEMNISGLDLTISSGNLVLSSPTGIPATTGASGIKGSFVWDSGFLYVCTSTNSWKRAALTTW